MHELCEPLYLYIDDGPEYVFYVYRLEEDVSLLKEGGVRLSIWVLRACSYKPKAEGWHQGLCPPILFKGFFWFLSFLLGLLSFNSFRMVVRQMSFILLCGTTIVPFNLKPF